MTTTKVRVPYSYLNIQLAKGTALHDTILAEWAEVLESGLFTLGPAVGRLEKAWAEYVGTKHAIAVNSGTDALIIAMKALGIGPGDEVITCPNTFVATVGAIVAVGAKPVFVDAGPDYLMDIEQINKVHTPHTKAVLPIDLTGKPASDFTDVPVDLAIMANLEKPLYIIRDACQSIGARMFGKSSGKFADLAAYSMHPLKNVHASNDGGMLVTDNDEWASFARLYRNHGLSDRDHVDIPGINSRLDTIGAVAAYHVLKNVEDITLKRNANAKQYDAGLKNIRQVTLPPRPGPEVRQAFHTYVVLTERRDELKAYLLDKGVQCAIHYPIPVHLQKGYAYLGYKKGDFPVVEYQAEHQLTLPIHEFLEPDQIEYVIECVKDFYVGR